MSQTVQPHNTSSEEEKLLTIGAMASLCHVTVRTLRYYEEMDLIGPEKRSSGKYRLYSERTIRRVKAIVALQELNYSLEQILLMLGPYSKTLHYNKADQVEATKHSLNLQKACIEEKLDDLRALSAEITQRLQVIEDICTPCVKESSEHHCRDHCTHRDVHFN